MTYLHPITGAALLVLLGYVGSLGLRLRQRHRDRAALARRHARLAPFACAGVLAGWLAGLASAAWLRDDLSLAGTLHFQIGTGMVALLSGSVVTARLMARGHATAREIHPWLGVGALLLAAAHVVAGLRIMP